MDVVEGSVGLPGTLALPWIGGSCDGGDEDGVEARAAAVERRGLRWGLPEGAHPLFLPGVAHPLFMTGWREKQQGEEGGGGGRRVTPAVRTGIG